MSDLGDKFIYALLDSGDMGVYLKMGDVGSLFTHVQSDALAFQKLETFIRTYHKLPELDTFEDMIGRDLTPSKETPMYYHDQIFERHVKKEMIASSQKAHNMITQDKDVIGAFKVLDEMVQAMKYQKMSPQLYDFRDSASMLAAEFQKKKRPDYGIEIGIPTFDNMAGGLRGGDMLSLIGRPAIGKSWLSLALALHAWTVQGKVPLFVSMEMTPIIIFERLAAMYQHIPYNWVKFGEFSNLRVDTKKRFLDAMVTLQDDNLPPFHVVDGNLTASVQDLTALANQLQPDFVVVDGAYMVEFDGFIGKDKVGAVCNAMKKDIATGLDIPVVASWQFNRASTKLKKTEKEGLEHIGYSDVIGQVSSLVLGMFQEESVETVKKREVRIMKGRTGEEGHFYTNWDFVNMDFSEIESIRDNKVMIT